MKVCLAWILGLLMPFVDASGDAIGPSDALTEHLERAYDSYREGEAATTVAEKQQSFNRALRLYNQLEGEPGNGKLYYNIGNSYYQLEQYGWAILYYLRAERLLPRDDRIQFHLTLAQAQQGLPLQHENKLENILLFWYLMLSQGERVQWFVAFSIALLLFVSLWIWRPSQTAKIGTYLTACGACLMLCTALYVHYFAPVDAVIVKAFGLYHGPREDYALVSDEPFVPGTVVTVDKVAENGTWLKIVAPDGKMGYVPSDVLRII